MSMAAPLGRQVGQVLELPTYQTDLRLSCLLAELSREPSTSASELHKVSLRITSLLHPNQDIAKGLNLALEFVRQVPWDVTATYASQWISLALTHFASAIREAIPLLNRLLGRQSKQKSEFWRNAASANVPKYALVLLEAAEADDTLEDDTVACVLRALTSQIKLHSTVYRTHAAKLQKVCTRLLDERRTLMAEVSVLLAALHRTGKGDDVQSQLWTTTLDLLIQDTELAWDACSSSFVTTSGKEKRDRKGLLSDLSSSDSLEALRQGLSRLALLLGMPPDAGVLGIFISERTSLAVPMPLDRLVSLLISILSITPSSTCRQDPAPEATLVAMQSALLPTAHIAALTFLASLPIGIFYARSSKVLSKILWTIEKSAAPVRCVAFHALVQMNLPLSPEDATLIRSARTCLAQIARLLQSAPDLTTEGKESGARGERSKKKRKIYESDKVQIGNHNRGLTEVDEDEEAACVAAIRYASMLYEGLATHLSAEHHDLAHTTVLVLLGLAEISLQQPGDVSAGTLDALAQTVRLSRGSVLALLTTRAASLAAQGLASEHHNTRLAATRLSQSLEYTFHPRLSAKLPLRLHIYEDRVDAGEEETVLEHVELEEDRGQKEREALRDVLGVATSTTTTTTTWATTADTPISTALPPASSRASLSPPLPSQPESPKRSSAGRPSLLQLSPDPVKPLHRPSTPRIGSPSLTHAAGNTASASAVLGGNASSTISSRSTSASPERTLNTHQLFGGQQPSGGQASGTAGIFISSTTASTAKKDASMNATTGPTPSSPLARAAQYDVSMADRVMDDGDSDDESLPEIDVRSSGEEDEDEEQEGDKGQLL